MHRMLIAACFALAGWAQAQPEAARTPGVVDTPQECRALGGAWVARGDWQRACQAPWDRAECLRLGGAWTPLVGAPAGGLCLASVSEAATARQCAAAGGRWGPPGSAMPLCQAGEPVAGATAPRKAPDAHKPCTAQRDCSYGCIHTGAEVPAGTEVQGQCRPDNRRSGCFTLVEGGRVAGRICLN